MPLATAFAEIEEVVHIKADVRQAGKVRVTIEGFFLDSFFRLDRLDDLIGKGIVQHTKRMPGQQLNIWGNTRCEGKPCERMV